MILYLIFFNCISGINYKNYGYSPFILINNASVSGNLHDIHFRGSFCPPQNGIYRLIYKGEIHPTYENLYSSYLYFGITSKNRTSNWFYLTNNKCYYYYTVHSIDNMFTTGILLYEFNNIEYIINSTVSLNCSNNFCKFGGIYPNCNFLEYSLNFKILFSKFLIFINIFILF